MEHFAKAGLRGATGAPILETLYKSGPPRGRGGASLWNTMQKRASAKPRGRQSLEHSAKAGLAEEPAGQFCHCLEFWSPRRPARPVHFPEKIPVQSLFASLYKSFGTKAIFRGPQAYWSYWPSPLRLSRNLAASAPPGRRSLKHSAKSGLRGSAGSPVLGTLCKSGPPRRRRGGNP